MSTRMTETDWVKALEVFQASLPRPAAKGRDDRLFLEGPSSFLGSQHHLAGTAGALRLVEQCVEALRPAEQGRRVRDLFDHFALLSSSAHLVQMFDSID